MYPTHAGLIECTMFVLWPHKYKIGHIDLIHIIHQNLLNSPKIPKFLHVSHLFYPSPAIHYKKNLYWCIKHLT